LNFLNFILFSKNIAHSIIIAYEPVYAIGTGDILSKSDIIDTVSYIKEVLNETLVNASIIYGGSVNADNLSDLLTISELDGFMVGKSSCSKEEVIKMMKLLSSN
jgi:triosephosphate isomerase